MQIIIYSNFELYNNAIETMSDVNTICRQDLRYTIMGAAGVNKGRSSPVQKKSRAYGESPSARASQSYQTTTDGVNMDNDDGPGAGEGTGSTLQWCATEGHAWLLHLMCYGLPPAMVQDDRGKKLRLMNLRYMGIHGGCYREIEHIRNM
ncbi:unnamed protein product [Spodoptera exigua]|nr:unnamed protein product [Spodoptera exigua]